VLDVRRDRAKSMSAPSPSMPSPARAPQRDFEDRILQLEKGF
jgi:hypothetical protein